MNNNLLVIGAGGHGICVKEAAESQGIYNRIDFLDDDPSSQAVGTWEDYRLVQKDFDFAFVALGNNKLRATWLDRLSSAGYQNPVIIHPTAYVSPSATIGEGTIILPNAVVHAGVVIGRGSIIGIGTMLDHQVIVGEFCHIDAGAIVKGVTIPTFSKIEPGSVIVK